MKNFARIESGKVVELHETDQDIYAVFHRGMVWVEVGNQPVAVGFIAEEEGGVWSFREQIAEPVSPDELRREALKQRDDLLQSASIRIAPLQYLVDLKEATDESKALLNQWKRYSVSLNSIEKQDGFPSDFSWPQPPVTEEAQG